jgi:hypothetical protein
MPTPTRIAAALAILALSVFPVRERLSAQDQPAGERTVPVTVTDRFNRFVAGLSRDQFEIVENGVVRRPTGFANPDAALCVAIVGEPGAASLKEVLGAQDELIEAASLDEAIQRVAASDRRRKAVILTGGAQPGPAPAGIQLVRGESAGLKQLLIELKNQYLVQYEPADPKAPIEVRFQQSSVLPVLKHAWKDPF